MDDINPGVNHLRDYLFDISSKVSTEYLASKFDESTTVRCEKKTARKSDDEEECKDILMTKALHDLCERFSSIECKDKQKKKLIEQEAEYLFKKVVLIQVNYLSFDKSPDKRCIVSAIINPVNFNPVNPTGSCAERDFYSKNKFKKRHPIRNIALRGSENNDDIKEQWVVKSDIYRKGAEDIRGESSNTYSWTRILLRQAKNSIMIGLTEEDITDKTPSYYIKMTADSEDDSLKRNIIESWGAMGVSDEICEASYSTAVSRLREYCLQWGGNTITSIPVHLNSEEQNTMAVLTICSTSQLNSVDLDQWRSISTSLFIPLFSKDKNIMDYSRGQVEERKHQTELESTYAHNLSHDLSEILSLSSQFIAGEKSEYLFGLKLIEYLTKGQFGLPWVIKKSNRKSNSVKWSDDKFVEEDAKFWSALFKLWSLLILYAKIRSSMTHLEGVSINYTSKITSLEGVDIEDNEILTCDINLLKILFENVSKLEKDNENKKIWPLMTTKKGGLIEYLGASSLIEWGPREILRNAVSHICSDDRESDVALSTENIPEHLYNASTSTSTSNTVKSKEFSNTINVTVTLNCSNKKMTFTVSNGCITGRKQSSDINEKTKMLDGVPCISISDLNLCKENRVARRSWYFDNKDRI